MMYDTEESYYALLGVGISMIAAIASMILTATTSCCVCGSLGISTNAAMMNAASATNVMMVMM